MIYEVERRLDEWARWARQRPGAGLGFRQKSNEYRICVERCHESGTKSFLQGKVPDNEKAEQTEAAINFAPEFYQVIIKERYLRYPPQNDREVAKSVHCSYNDLRKYLDEVHVFLAARLSIQWTFAPPGCADNRRRVY